MKAQVDPALADWLAQIAPAFGPIDYNLAPAKLAKKLRARAPAPQFPQPEGLTIEDHAVPVAGGTITVRRYLPLEGTHGGAVLNYHGGGWVLGNLASDELRCRAMCLESGCQVFSVDYRLAPEFRFPVPAEDSYAALLWLADMSDDFGVDRARIGVAGSSAGGNLAAAVTLMARDRCGPAIAFQLLIYPVCDPDEDRPSWRDHGERFPLTQEDMHWFWEQYAPGEAAIAPYTAVLRAPSLTGLPPAHVALAQCDLLHDEGMAYAQRLESSGVPVSVGVHAGMVHGFLTVAPDHATSRAALSGFGTILREALGAGG